MIGQTQGRVPDNTQHSQKTDIHAADGIGTHGHSNLETADLNLRPRGHQDLYLVYKNQSVNAV